MRLHHLLWGQGNIYEPVCGPIGLVITMKYLKLSKLSSGEHQTATQKGMPKVYFSHIISYFTTIKATDSNQIDFVPTILQQILRNRSRIAIVGNSCIPFLFKVCVLCLYYNIM